MIFSQKMHRTNPSGKFPFKDPVKDATIVALKRAVDPLVELMLDAGVTVHEFSQLVRERSVWSASRRVIKENGRDSKSRVAIITGLPRSEVARILKSEDISSNKRLGQHPARKLLAAWYDDPRFLAANGDPAVLPIFGKRRSFEQLVSMHSRGIPIRAMLDELTQIDAVERLPDQKVKAKSRTPILTGLTSDSIGVIGERARDLLETLTNNVRHPSKPFFEGTALAENTDSEIVSLLRREIAEQAANFINSANSLLNRFGGNSKRSNAKSTPRVRLGVTVYYFQDDIEGSVDSKAEKKRPPRKNLQRQRRLRRGPTAVRHSGAKVEL